MTVDSGEPREAPAPPDSPDAAESTGAGVTAEATVAAAPPDPEALARVRSIVESLLFVADGPVPLAKLQEPLQEADEPLLRPALAALAAESGGRGIVLTEVAGGFQLRSSPANAEYVQRFLAHRPVRLSRAQLETLAIVAYRQPITRPEIDEIRGVDSGAVMKLLLDRQLVRILGKKEEPGRPLLYGTTKEFLAFFNLRDLRDLPTLREFHELSEEHKAQVEALGGLAAEGDVEAVADEAAGDGARATLIAEGAANDSSADLE